MCTDEEYQTQPMTTCNWPVASQHKPLKCMWTRNEITRCINCRGPVRGGPAKPLLI